MKRFWQYWFWFFPANLVYLALDSRWGGPFFGENTGPGRIERSAQSGWLCGVMILGALWLSLPRLHTPRRMKLFRLAAFAAALADLYYFSSLFGWGLFALAMSSFEIGARDPARQPAQP